MTLQDVTKGWFFALNNKATTMTKLYTLTALFLFSLASCKSATKAFDRGNYAEAIEISVKKLQKDPYDTEAQYVLLNAYKYAVSQHDEQIRMISSGNHDNRWEQLYYQYSELQQLYDNIRQSPAAVKAAKPVNYADYVRTYRDKTAESKVEKGIAFMQAQRNDKSGFREAYYAFKAALRFKPNDFEITQLLRAAKDSATVDVVILSVDRNNGYSYSTSYQAQHFQNDLVRTINNQINNEFVQFYSEWDARSENIQPDEVLDLRLGTLMIGRPYDETFTREVSKEVVIKEIVYNKDSVVKQYGKVYARITTTKRTLVSYSDLFVDARDADGYSLWADKVRGEHRWHTEFATYTGDERALSDTDKAQLNRSQSYPPSEREITEKLLRQMQNELSYRLRRYYRES